jgi:hypothetical protein
MVPFGSLWIECTGEPRLARRLFDEGAKRAGEGLVGVVDPSSPTSRFSPSAFVPKQVPEIVDFLVQQIQFARQTLDL